MTKQGQTVSQLELEFDALVYVDGKPSPDTALEIIKRQIGWLEYVNEDELTEKEAQRLALAMRRAYVELRTLTAKYID